MGEETKDWKIWLDEYNSELGNITINADDYLPIDFDSYEDWITIQDPYAHNNITLTGGGEEMLRVAEDGFYVRGVRVEADAKEAEQVYRAFKQWLTWASLSKNDEE